MSVRSLTRSQAIVGTCQGLTALASVLTFISMAYFTERSPSVTAKSVSRSAKYSQLTSLRAKPLFDQLLIWLLVYGGAAAVVQLLYFAVVGFKQFRLAHSSQPCPLTVHGSPG